MAASKNLILGSSLFGGAFVSADAFVVPGVPSQRGAPSSLRGIDTETLAQPTVNQFPTVVVAAASVAVLGTFAVSVRRGAGGRKRASNIVRAFIKESEIGAQDPPFFFFDPLNLCKDEATFRDYRTKELKHGRAAMMGALGMLTQSVVQVPGMEGVPKDVTACLVGNGQVGFVATVAIIGILDAVVFQQDDRKPPGNFGNPLPLVNDYSDEMRGKELNNGRIAMFAAIGQIAAGLYTGKSAIEQFGQ